MSQDGGPLGDATRRRHLRVRGPFEGTWVSALPVQINIHDLGGGGCLIESFHEPSPGRRIEITIDLPFHGLVQVTGEVLYTHMNYGFAVRFVDVPIDVQQRIDDVVARLSR